ncbi:hypothetical protein GYMLUDRAFT_886116 [Collybiopsis luxurians FD-317 M1]|uniref:Cytochrome P450 n=1 Tax=Collybiopsis luxurians FD-317 M1 TaxID=944289 RepID=A0A0D0CAD9_9AGAR|nr:hypothetical protein GYMLUDRAFT_886116 [Collybiopsis luxurians FD-317 M1]
MLHIVLSSLSFSYLAALCLYRLFFHPLHRYPGPTIAALTGWYELYHNIFQGGGLVAEIEKLHELYGPVVRIGPNTLHFNDWHAYHDIYTHGTTLVKEPRFYRGINAHARESSAGFLNPQEARNRRALLAPSFSRQAVMKLEYTIQLKVDQLVSLLREHYSSPDSAAKISIAYRSLTTDVITDYCFANSMNTLADPNFSHPVAQQTRDLVKRFWIQVHFPFIIDIVQSLPEKFVLWLIPYFASFVDVKARFERQIDSLISNLDATDHETVFHNLLAPKDPQMRPSRTSLVHEAFTLIGAGSDTVGHACTVGTYFALQDHSISIRLAEELRKAWPDEDRSMSFSALEKLPYLTAFIKEALRMSIGVIHPLPRIVSDETPEIGGLKLPAGTIVAMSHYFMQMNPGIFGDPYTFNPDRWLVRDTDKMMLNFVPFGKGPRQWEADLKLGKD